MALRIQGASSDKTWGAKRNNLKLIAPAEPRSNCGLNVIVQLDTCRLIVNPRLTKTHSKAVDTADILHGNRHVEQSVSLIETSEKLLCNVVTAKLQRESPGGMPLWCRWTRRLVTLRLEETQPRREWINVRRRPRAGLSGTDFRLSPSVSVC